MTSRFQSCRRILISKPMQEVLQQFKCDGYDYLCCYCKTPLVLQDHNYIVGAECEQPSCQWAIYWTVPRDLRTNNWVSYNGRMTQLQLSNKRTIQQAIGMSLKLDSVSCQGMNVSMGDIDVSADMTLTRALNQVLVSKARAKVPNTMFSIA